MDPNHPNSNNPYVPPEPQTPRLKDELADLYDRMGGPIFFYGCLLPNLLLGAICPIVVLIETAICFLR